ncbi:uncharacterized protein LODBEIA_P33530 [Lodderomyces beijingensis]|uniref:Altered inheritance of mitochondria protein 23, mitochondrial n=1 Tax=Lodderomyces beijingensis TaxID=1775926 RepID=A0ABP0ZLW9_9ASCO
MQKSMSIPIKSFRLSHRLFATTSPRSKIDFSQFDQSFNSRARPEPNARFNQYPNHARTRSQASDAPREYRSNHASPSSSSSSSSSSSNRVYSRYGANHRNDRMSYRDRNDRNDRNNRRDELHLEQVLSRGTETAQAALKLILSRISEQSPDFTVETITPGKGVTTCKIHTILSQLDLSKEGIQVTHRPNVAFPLVKSCPVSHMMRAYQEERSATKELELLKAGSFKTIKSIENKLKAKQKQSKEKSVYVSWGININDLRGQKFQEIQRRIEDKGEKLSLYIVHDKSKPNLHVSAVYRDPQTLELEMKRRNMVVDVVESLIGDEVLGWKWSREGTIETKLVYSIVPNPAVVAARASTKKEAKAAKLAKAEEKKSKSKYNNGGGLPLSNKKTTSEEDLDALYSMKIED